MRRFWVKVCGNQFFSQFDLEGNEHEWQEYNHINPNKVLFLPFPPEFAKLVNSKKTASVVSCSLPSIEIEINTENGNNHNNVEWCRKSIIKMVPHTICGFCGYEFDEGVIAECPRCFASKHWYCDQCDEFKLNQKTDDQDRVLCPDCELRGLMRVDQICEFWDEHHNYYNIIQFGDEKHIILDYLVRHDI